MLSSTLTPPAPVRPLSVVVVDDVLEIQQLVSHWLIGIGCKVACASSGEEVIRLLRTHHFDVVITDVIMPEGDGLEVISEAKRVMPAARLLAISGGGNHFAAQDCLRFAKGLGAHAVLLKPFNRDQMLAAVNQLIAGGSDRGSAAPAGA